MSKVVVFDTFAEAEAQQALDYEVYIASIEDGEYKAQTTEWAAPIERIDGKWDYPVCPNQDYTGLTLEDFDANNYPTE